MSSPATSSPPSHKRGPPDVELTSTGRLKKQKTDPLEFIGKHFARTVEMFTLPQVILTRGVIRDGDGSDDDDPSSYSEEYDPSYLPTTSANITRENALYKMYQALMEMSPDLRTRVTSGPSIKSVAQAVSPLFQPPKQYSERLL
jgi:hypothetical protein